MSPFTRCQSKRRRANPLPPAVIAKWVLIMAVVVGLGWAHVYLRVHLTSMRREIGMLQGDQGRLLSEINAVRTDNEALKTPRNLQAFARNELDMVAYNPANRETIVMPEQIQTRYALARAGNGRPGDAPVSTQERWLSSIGERIGLVNEAQAAE
jgi:hypothetical protein